MIEAFKKIFWQLLIVFLLASFLFWSDFAFVKGSFGDIFPRHLFSWIETFGVVLLLSVAFRRKGLFIFFFISYN